MIFDNLSGYILSISLCTQSFITIVHLVRTFSLFQNLELGTASTDVKCHFAISWVRFWQSLCLDHVSSNGYAKFYQNIPKGSRDRASFMFFRIWTSAKPRPIPNIIWQSQWLHFININVYAKFHHNILHSSRDRAILLFHNLELGKASTDKICSFAISWARSCQYQCLRKSLSKCSTQFKR